MRLHSEDNAITSFKITTDVRVRPVASLKASYNNDGGKIYQEDGFRIRTISLTGLWSVDS